MREQTQAQQGERKTCAAGYAAWFIAGAAAGILIGILFAPRSGRATRGAISGTSHDLYGRSREVYRKGRLVVNDAAELFERGRKMASGGMDA